jgi:hypothetical protein
LNGIGSFAEDPSISGERSGPVVRGPGRRRARRLWAGPLITLPIIAACDASSGDGAIRADSAGVEIVTSRAQPPSWDVEVDTVRLIGGEASGPRSFFRVRRPLIDVDAAGRIYVLDASQHRVVAMTDEGDVVGLWGSEGEGPGELSAPLSVSVSETGIVTVHDAGRARLVSYGPEGGLTAERPAVVTVISIGLRHVEETPSGLVFWSRDPYSGTDERFDRLLLAGAGDTMSMSGAMRSPTSTAHHPRCGVTFTAPIALAPRIHWSQWGDRVAVAASSDFGVHLFERGRFTRSVRSGDAAETLSRSDVIALLEEREVLGPCASEASDYVEKHGFNERPQLVNAVTLHPDGGMWVLGAARGSEERITVFDSSGTAAGTLPRDVAMPIAFLPDGRALIQIVDSFDVERIGVVELAIVSNGIRGR